LERVAEYYEVTQEVIRDNIRRNREELKQNGMKFMKYSEIKYQVNCENFSHLKISRQGTNIFSKRAVLNIGMLLRDSEIAKRVRSALLDLEEITTNEQKTISIDKEKELLLNIITAETKEHQAIALNEYRQYYNRHIKQLEDIIEQQKPKVEEWERFIDTKGYTTIAKFAKALNIKKLGRNKMFELLRNKNVLKSNNEPYQQYINQGCFKVVFGNAKNGYSYSQIVLTKKGVEWLYNKLKDWNYITKD